jgi:hypothetical protein
LLILDNEFFDADYEGAMSIVKDVLKLRGAPLVPPSRK